jgi:ATP-dependent helicase HrpB
MAQPLAAPPPAGLPIDPAEQSVRSAVADRGSLVLVAEPGAGKSTVVPAWLALDRPGRVMVLQPRRLAARATAARLAQRWGEDVGGLVGLTIRDERRVSPRTRVEVVTEAVLTRRLQDDPSLDGVSAVVFDEWHERHLHTDLGLALTLETRSALRADLAVVIMSATLDPEPVAALLGGSPVVRVPGRTHPVDTVHLPRPTPSDWAGAVAAAVHRALAETAGDVLVFVPGRGEIDAVARLVRPGPAVEVTALHAGVSRAEQSRLLAPGSDRRRRVVLATAVAETSVTLPGITAVVDGGRQRQPRYDERTGLGRLETVGVTRFAADQRRGRAGRTGPGRCYRLWSVEDDRHLAPASPPEVRAGDPLPLALELARWGDPAGTALSWVDPPPPDRLTTARAALVALGLCDPDGRLTPAGRTAARLPLHPRLGALVLAAADRGLGALGVAAAAVLDDAPTGRGGDLRVAVERLAHDPTGRRRAARLARRAGIASDGPVDGDELPALLAAAWPDRVGQQRNSDPARYRLAGGGEVRLPRDSGLGAPELVVVADAGGLREPPTVGAAVPLDRPTLVRAAGGAIVWSDEVRWDDQSGEVSAVRLQRLGHLVLHREPHPDPPRDAVVEALLYGVRRGGLGRLGWTGAARDLQARVTFLRHHGLDLPAFDDTALADSLDDWLAPSLGARTTMDELGRLDPAPLLLRRLDHGQRRLLDRLAPASLATPTGRDRPLRYEGETARWAVRLQDLFGLDEHPTVVDGRVPVVVELLSPAGRPAQVTTDLPGFWRGSYRQVRAELRGRYPKHRWPEDPLTPT